MSRRWIAVGVLGLWMAGLGLLVRREYFRPHLERLAEGAARVNPSMIYFQVLRDGQQMGYASSNVDTASTAISAIDFFEVGPPGARRTHRTTVETRVLLSRTFQLRSFDYTEHGFEAGPSGELPVFTRATAHFQGDSAMTTTVAHSGVPALPLRIPLSGPILLPTLIPLAIALAERPRVGKHYLWPLFDPATMQSSVTTIDVRAESLFVVNDSAVFDSAANRWRGVTPDTVRSWQIVSDSGRGFTGWIDEQGRVVATTQLGYALRREPYEVAYENWRLMAVK